MKDYSLFLAIASLMTLSSCVTPTTSESLSTSTGGSMSNSQESSSISNS